MKEEQYKQINMQLIIHYKGSRMVDVITPSADQYNPILKTNITERLIRNEDGTITSLWNKLSSQELKMANDLINDNNYTDYVSWMNMNKRNEKIDKLLNKNY